MSKYLIELNSAGADFAANANERSHLRYVTDQIAVLKLGQFSSFVDTIDISRGGARCRISSGFAPFENDGVSLTFLDGTQRTGIVRWSKAQAFGLEFERELPDPQDHLHYEHLGYDYFREIARLQKLIHK